MSKIKLSLSAQFDRELFWEAGRSVRHLVANLSAQDLADTHKAERLPLNVALVIDASGSMARGRLDAAKQAALGFVERLSETDRLTLVSFASDIKVHLDTVPATKDNLKRIRSEISALETRGMTCLSGGWFAGVECTSRLAEEDSSMTPRVIILSDGHANEGITNPTALAEHARELRLRGVLTSTLGIGDGYDESLLRSIAENGGGRLHDAELISEISSVLLGELDDIYSTIVENAKISFTAPPGVRVDIVGTGTASMDECLTTIDLGPVQNAVPRIAVFRLTCPQAEPGTELIVRIKATGFVSGSHETIETNEMVYTLTSAAGDANSAQPRNKNASEAVAKMWSAQIIATAAKMNRDRTFQEAKHYLRQQLHFFERYVAGLKSGQELAADLNSLHRHIDNEMSPRMHKEMTLHASLAMSSRLDRRGDDKESWARRMRRGD